METIQLSVNYGGALIDINIYPEENARGMIYPVEMNGNYSFTLHINENDDWDILRESNGTTPSIENDLFNQIIKKLEYELRYAA